MDEKGWQRVCLDDKVSISSKLIVVWREKKYSPGGALHKMGSAFILQTKGVYGHLCHIPKRNTEGNFGDQFFPTSKRRLQKSRGSISSNKKGDKESTPIFFCKEILGK